MTYSQAENCFTDGMKHARPQKDPALYDLHAGLSELAGALESDLRDLKAVASQILEALQYLARQ